MIMPNIQDSIFGVCVSVLAGAACAEMDFKFLALGFIILAIFSLFLGLLAYLNGTE